MQCDHGSAIVEICANWECNVTMDPLPGLMNKTVDHGPWAKELRLFESPSPVTKHKILTYFLG